MALIYIQETIKVLKEPTATNDKGRIMMCLHQEEEVSRTKDFPGCDPKLRGQGVSRPMIWIPQRRLTALVRLLCPGMGLGSLDALRSSLRLAST